MLAYIQLRHLCFINVLRANQRRLLEQRNREINWNTSRQRPFGYLLLIRACVNFTNSPGRPTYLLSGLYIPWNSSNMGQIRTMPEAKEGRCLCVFDRDREGKGKTKPGTDKGNYRKSVSVCNCFSSMAVNRLKYLITINIVIVHS